MSSRPRPDPEIAPPPVRSVLRVPDAVSFLTLYLLLLFLMPSRLTIAPLGAAGTPAMLVGLAGFAWWVFHSVQRTSAPRGLPQPVRTGYVLFGCCVLASYVAAMSRPIDATESSVADLGLVATAAWGGVLLLANDGIDSRDRLTVVLRRLALAGGALATLGIVQFVTGTSFVDRISIPGLHANWSLGGVGLRNGFNRPSGTALHPIEFGSVIAMILPLALTLAMNDRTRGRLRRWYPVGAIGVASALSISRSALIATFVALVLLGATWDRGRRIAAAAVVVGVGGALFVTVPGLLGSLMGMFTGIGDDSSAQSRSGSYGIAMEFVERSPVVGRGLFTFLPRYRILDNQYLSLLIELGVVGLAVFGLLILAAVRCGRAVRLHAVDPANRELGQALVASVCAGAAGLALFDGFSFPMSAGLFFLVLGLAGAAWRLEREERRHYEASALRPAPSAGAP